MFPTRPAVDRRLDGRVTHPGGGGVAGTPETPWGMQASPGFPLTETQARCGSSFPPSRHRCPASQFATTFQTTFRTTFRLTFRERISPPCPCSRLDSQRRDGHRDGHGDLGHAALTARDPRNPTAGAARRGPTPGHSGRCRPAHQAQAAAPPSPPAPSHPRRS